jgi:hypothetical protein
MEDVEVNPSSKYSYHLSMEVQFFFNMSREFILVETRPDMSSYQTVTDQPPALFKECAFCHMTPVVTDSFRFGHSPNDGGVDR